MSALRAHRSESGSGADSAQAGRFRGQGPSEERRTVVLIGTLLAFESSMYSAVTPVLPHYAHSLHAAKPAVGLLAASYPAGIIPGSMLGGWLAARIGVRRTTLFGLLLFAATIAAFGFGTSLVALDSLRFLQGLACGFVWGGGLTWAIAAAPSEGRGAVLGSVFAAAILGTLLGPILGTLAVAVNTEVVFSVVAVIAVGLAVWTAGHAEPQGGEAGAPLAIRPLLRDRRILLGVWLVLLEAATLGALGTLLPLRLSRLGATGIAIGVTFLLASALSASLSRPIGRMVDRSGAALPLSVGLALSAALMILTPVPESAITLALISIVTLGGPLTAYTIPATSLITASAERAGVAMALATMLMNLAWATGETIGAPVAADVSHVTSDAVPLLGLAVIMLATLVMVRRARLPRPAEEGEVDDVQAEPSGAVRAGASTAVPEEPDSAAAEDGVHPAAAVATSTP